MEEKEYCPQCGIENPKEDQFCSHCGTIFYVTTSAEENQAHIVTTTDTPPLQTNQSTTYTQPIQ